MASGPTSPDTRPLPSPSPTGIARSEEPTELDVGPGTPAGSSPRMQQLEAAQKRQEELVGAMAAGARRVAEREIPQPQDSPTTEPPSEPQVEKPTYPAFFDKIVPRSPASLRTPEEIARDINEGRRIPAAPTKTSDILQPREHPDRAANAIAIHGAAVRKAEEARARAANPEPEVVQAGAPAIPTTEPIAPTQEPPERPQGSYRMQPVTTLKQPTEAIASATKKFRNLKPWRERIPVIGRFFGKGRA